MSLWHRAILLTVGTVAVATEEMQKFMKRAVNEVQTRVDRDLTPEKKPKMVERPAKA